MVKFRKHRLHKRGRGRRIGRYKRRHLNSNQAVARTVNNVFPDRLYVRMKTVIDFDDLNTQSGGAYINQGQNYIFKGNSCLSQGPAIAWGSSFANNVPSGLIYLLSSPVTSGSIAPYGSFRIAGSKIKVRLQPYQHNYYDGTNNNQGNIATFPAIRCTLVPARVASFSGTNFQTIIEEPYAKNWNQSAYATAGKIPLISSFMSTKKMFGLKYAASMEGPYFQGAVGSDPVNTWYWHLVWNVGDTSLNSGKAIYTCSMMVQVEIDTYVEFFNRNQYASTAPS